MKPDRYASSFQIFSGEDNFIIIRCTIRVYLEISLVNYCNFLTLEEVGLKCEPKVGLQIKNLGRWITTLLTIG